MIDSRTQARRKARRFYQRAMVYGVVSDLRWQDLRPYYEIVNHSCYWCNTSISFFKLQQPSDEANKATFDHIVSMSRGGANTLSNIVPSCYACNFIRAHMDDHAKYRPVVVQEIAERYGRLHVLDKLRASCGILEL